MKLLYILAGQVIPHATISSLLAGYARPNDKINRLEKQGELVALKRGLYALKGSQSPPKELIANHISGPSYISRQRALAYYGLINERVATVTSMCIGRSREFENAFGQFSYHAVPARYYSTGLRSLRLKDCAVMIATPEKALCDLLVSVRYLRLQSKTAVLNYLFDDLQMDEDDLLSLDYGFIKSLARAGYKASLMNLLADALESLHD